MRNEYEMVTVADYISGLNNVKCVSIEEKEIEVETCLIERGSVYLGGEEQKNAEN